MMNSLLKWCAALAFAWVALTAAAADPPPAPDSKDAPASEPAAPAAAAPGGAPAAGTESAPAASPVPAATPADPRTLGRPTVREPEVLARFTAGLLPADFIKLGDDSAPFLARYVKAGKPPVTEALLYLPAPADFVGNDSIVACALRQAADNSQSVLAVQLPLATALGPGAEPAALHDQSLARAKAALEQLGRDGAKTIVVVGRAEQVALARELAADGASNVRAVAAIGPWTGKLGESPVPLFDIVPQDDASAAASAEARRNEARAAQLTGYRQHVIEAADRHFLGHDDDIARRIAGWAAHLPAPKQEPAKAP